MSGGAKPPEGRELDLRVLAARVEQETNKIIRDLERHDAGGYGRARRISLLRRNERMLAATCGLRDFATAARYLREKLNETGAR